MVRKLKFVFSFFFKLIVSFQFYFDCGFASEEIEAENNFSKLNFCNSECRIEKLEAHNQRQEHEIFSLKTVVDSDKQMIKLLNNRVSQLEALVVKNSKESDQKDDPKARSKRPASLLPAQFDYGVKPQSDHDTDKRFYGPPTNCEDMENLGYTLNGFYIVNGEDEFKKKRVEIVLCRFRIPQGSNDLREERLGFPTMEVIRSQTSRASKSTSTALTTQKNPKDCTPLWHLKIGQNTCLKVEKRRYHFRPSASECNSYSQDQTWAKIQDTKFRFQICKKELIEKCLTVSEELNGRNRAVSLENFVKGSENQLWMINEKQSRLENVDSGLCLINVGMVSFFASGIEARVCPKNSMDKMGGDWSFVPLNNCAY